MQRTLPPKPARMREVYLWCNNLTTIAAFPDACRKVYPLIAEQTLTDWILLVIACIGIGLSKSGVAGIGMVHVIVFAHVFGAFDSTGILLPLLIVGDVLAIRKFGKHVDWRLVKLLFPPAIVGVVIGWALMGRLPDRAIQVLLGSIILGLTLLQIVRIWKPHWFGKTSHSTAFALGSGLLAGFTTMIANAAGPVISLYLLSISTPKLQLVGTSCWFFFWLNTAKLPFSYQLGLISGESLLLNLILAPTVAIGIAGGSFILHHIPQKLFNSLILLFTAIASLRLIGVF